LGYWRLIASISSLDVQIA